MVRLTRAASEVDQRPIVSVVDSTAAASIDSDSNSISPPVLSTTTTRVTRSRTANAAAAGGETHKHTPSPKRRTTHTSNKKKSTAAITTANTNTNTSSSSSSHPSRSQQVLDDLDAPLSPRKPSTSAKKKGDLATASLRKGSDARREETAKMLASETDRLEKLYKEQTAQEEQKRIMEEREARQRMRRCAEQVVKICFVYIPIIIVALGGLFLASQHLDLDLLFGPSAGSPPPFGPSSRSAVTRSCRTLQARLPDARRQIDQLESALIAHTQSFEQGLHAGYAPSEKKPDTDSQAWTHGAIGLAQAPKPLVVVLVTETAQESHMARDLIESLALALATSTDEPEHAPTSHIPLVRVHDLSALLGQTSSLPWSHVTPRDLRAVFARELIARRTSFPPLAQGIVYVTAADTMPRQTAEVFHRYVDDVSAPSKQTMFVFEVNVSGAHGADATQRVANRLQTAWASTQNGIDEVIQPLLSRVIRNVIDMRV